MLAGLAGYKGSSRFKSVATLLEGDLMTLCPIALAVGCKKCPAFSVCPVKSVIGDMPKEAPPTRKATGTKKK